MCFNQRGDISTLNGRSLKLVEKFTYLGSSVASSENDINTWRAKAWTAIDRLSVIRKSDLLDKIKRCFFQAAVVSILLYRCTTWTLTKRMERKLDSNCTRMLQAVLSKFWRQYPTKLQLYWHQPSISKTIQTRRARHAGHCRRSKGLVISDVILWTPSHRRARAGRPDETYRQLLYADTGCSIENLPKAMDDKDEWRERVREIRASCMPWWYMYIYIYIYIYTYVYTEFQRCTVQ